MKIVEKTTTVEAIVKLFVKRIEEGQYLAGEKLPSERLLQNELGVGRLALREALSRLNAMGIITTEHGRGTFVQSTIKSETFRSALIPYFAMNDPGRLQDLVIARGMLESEIASLVAQQRTENQIAQLHKIIDFPFSAGARHEALAQQDLLFHRTLAEMIDNRFLTTMHEALVDHIQLFLIEFVKSKRSPEEVMDAHKPILKAIENRDPEEARKMARLHVAYSKEDYENYIKSNTLKGE